MTDAERWESLADRHTAGMFGPLRSRVEGNVTAAQERWGEVVKVRRGGGRAVRNLMRWYLDLCRSLE